MTRFGVLLALARCAFSRPLLSVSGMWCRCRFPTLSGMSMFALTDTAQGIDESINLMYIHQIDGFGFTLSD
ncbi:hypothetical protein ACERK3_09765 [Phycisphaerales bacterium AB-hyl4]|uniref:Secreted protein n=1 Tax=Natronomicrosphaera hydrolytica TaxID=3242702 RepID=A0ABV4U4W8_9BACT